MRPLARSFALLLALGFVACSKRPIDADDGGAGSIGTGQAGAAGSRGGATTGTGGGAIAGTIGGSAIAGSNGGGAIAGNTGGGAIAGSTGGGAIAGSTGGGGATAGSGGATAGAGGGNSLGPVRLIIFYTRWGTAYPEWWPTGTDRNFTMSGMLQPLEPYKRDIILVSGLANANVASNGETNLANASETGDAMITLLTARPALTNARADGPSFDTVIGDCGGTAGPPLRLAVGQFGFDDNPGVSFGADGLAIRGERDPRAAAMRVLGHDVTAPDPTGDIDANYPALGAAHMDVAAEALATSKACVVTLMWGDHVAPRWLGATQSVHELSHLANSLYPTVSSQPPASDPSNPFVKLQTWYAQQLASLLDRLRATPLGAGTLLDRSVVLWISDSGAGQDHTGAYIPIVIAGGGGGRLDVGRAIEVKPHIPASGQFIEYWSVTRTQGDLLLALAQLWGAPPFGDTRIARQPLAEILKP